MWLKFSGKMYSKYYTWEHDIYEYSEGDYTNHSVVTDM